MGVKTLDDMYAAVKEFHLAFGMPVSEEPIVLPEERIELRVSLVREESVSELNEVLQREGSDNDVDVIDALIDTAYVCLGAMVEMGAVPSRSIPAEEYAQIQEKPPFRSADWIVDGRYSPGAAGRFSRTIDFSSYADSLEVKFAQEAELGWNGSSADLLFRIAESALRLMTISGLDSRPFFDIVQQSNMSKLGADGKPIYSRGWDLDGAAEGKVLKGPNYFQAEPQLRKELMRQMPVDAGDQLASR